MTNKSSATLQVERFDTPTGPVQIVTDEAQRLRAVDWVDFEDRMLRLLRHGGAAPVLAQRAAAAPSAARLAIEAYFSGQLDAIDALPTMAAGTGFQQQVWAALRRIPAGRTVSYGALAASIGRPAAMRAVGMANGANPIPIVVPCHRVIGADGTLTGFGGGLERKRWLLAHEGAQLRLPAR